MIRGLYTGASGMIAGMDRVDALSHNLANASTTGFKRTQVTSRSFSDLLGQVGRLSQNGSTPTLRLLGDLGMGAGTDASWLVVDAGPMRHTGDPLQVAIDGPGFFAVETAGGERYTRDGRFRVDAEGWLVTANGQRVLGVDGPVQLTGADGAISSQAVVTSGGTAVGELRVVTFASGDALMPEGGNLYRSTASSGDASATTGRILTETVEESNVNTVAEMVELIEATRLYEANQRVILAYDDTLAKAVSEVGRV